MPSANYQRKKAKKKKKKKLKVKADDVWYGGAHKYRKGAGKKWMRKAIEKFERWNMTKPEANSSEKNKFLESLCKVRVAL